MRPFIRILIVISCLFIPIPSIASSSPDTINLLHDTMSAHGHLEVAGEPIIATGLVSLFYQRRDFKPAWTDLNYAARIVDVLGTSDEDGLFPSDYHHRVLVKILNDLDNNHPDTEQLIAHFDLLLTDGVLLYATHMVNGKIIPADHESTWNYDDVELLPEKIINNLNRHIDDQTVIQALADLRPKLNIYNQLQEHLKFFTRLANTHHFQQLSLPGTMRNGDADPGLLALRNRLALLGFQTSNQSSSQFDKDLEDAVRDFQARYHLETDGVVGPATLRELNISFSERADQIRINMERTRWVADDLTSMVLVVNIAGFKLWVARDSQVVWTTDVMTGTIRTKTPVFKARMTYLVFNPTWTAPRSITREMLPKLKRDPSILAAKNYRLFDKDGKMVDPNSLDWSSLTGRTFPYTLVQMPGKDNALGQVKFMFPNKHAIYLHDTPSKHLFEKKQRAFSHGCIRVKNPLHLSEILLNDPENWNRSDIDTIITNGTLKNVKLKEPVEVLIMYWTAQPGENGELVFLPDVYSRDSELIAALKKPLF